MGEIQKYELNVAEGSGWQGANWVIFLAIPGYGIWPTRWVTIRAFETEEEAKAEAAKMVVELLHSASRQS